MTVLTDIYRELHDAGVYMFDKRMGSGDAAVIEMGGEYGLFLDTRRISTLAEEKAAVAHEAGHIFTGATHALSSPYDVIERHECRANRWAIKKLVPEDELVSVYRSGIRESWDLAEHFGVTDEFMASVLSYYRDHGREAAYEMQEL